MFQSQHDELEAKFFEEKAALEAKYQKLYGPLYSKVTHTFCCNVMQSGLTSPIFLFKKRCMFYVQATLL